MKKLLSVAIAMVTTLTATAQTLNIKTGSVTTAVKASEAGEMAYSDGGQTLTVCGKAFSTSDIAQIYVDNADVADNTVSISYSGTTASVVVAGNVAQYLTTTVDGANVTILQSEDLAEEITYSLSGTSTDGSFTMDGKLKATVVLNGVNLTSQSGAPINIQNGKRINIEVASGTTNTFSDAASGTQKACFFVNGHAEFTGSGTVNITGNARHGYRSDEYTKLKKSFTGTLNIVKAASDGLHIEQYLEMNGGNVVVSNVGGDGIDVAATNDETDEQNGQVLINGGTITVTTSADDVKGLKAEADITITGGTLNLLNSGAGAKAVSTKGAFTMTAGRLEAAVTGDVYHKDKADESKPHGVKSTGNLTLEGGEIYVAATNKAITTDATFTVNGGTLMGIGSKVSAVAAGSQKVKTYTKVKVDAGATVSRDGISYTVPASYSCSSAYVMVSPY